MIETRHHQRLRIARVAGADPALPLPSYATPGAAAMDLAANFPEDVRAVGLILEPGRRALVPTGIAVAIPPGFEVQVRPRSGLALRHGIMLVNSPGTIDADYRGEIGVILLNAGEEAFAVAHGDRIAQMVLAPVVQVEWAPVARLDATGRGGGGFGSTGV